MQVRPSATSPKGNQRQSLEPHVGREGVWWPTYAIAIWGWAKKIQEDGLLNALSTTELTAANAPCTRFQDQEQISVSLARRSNAVSSLRFGSGDFSRTPDKKKPALGRLPLTALQQSRD
jgi:hypothetical protein